MGVALTLTDQLSSLGGLTPSPTGTLGFGEEAGSKVVPCWAGKRVGGVGCGEKNQSPNQTQAVTVTLELPGPEKAALPGGGGKRK